MAANTLMITPITPRTSHSAAMLTGNAAYDGTGVSYLAATGGTNGTRLDKITVASLGTNVATSVLFFVNDGLGTAAVNNTLAHTATLAATTASAVAGLVITDITITQGSNVVCPIPYLGAGQKLNVVIGTTVAAGFQTSVFCGDY